MGNVIAELFKNLVVHTSSLWAELCRSAGILENAEILENADSFLMEK